MRVLVAEDDAGLRSVIERGLKENGYIVDAVPDGEIAARYFDAYDYDAAVLDWRMPKRSGLELVQQLRRRGDRTPLLMLTARDAASDRITGLDTGADDYLVKPFDFGELLARLRALQRRPGLTLGPVIECADLVFDPATRQVTVDGELVTLTSTEMSVLEILMRRSPAVVTRRAIAVQGWDDEADAVGSNTIDVHMGRLRAKLNGSQARIDTVRGSGYRLVSS
jgi:DNA-binding response OmpR family regulator